MKSSPLLNKPPPANKLAVRQRFPRLASWYRLRSQWDHLLDLANKLAEAPAHIMANFIDAVLPRPTPGRWLVFRPCLELLESRLVPSTFLFSQSNYAVLPVSAAGGADYQRLLWSMGDTPSRNPNETAALTVTVKRTGSLADAASVDYASSDNTAAAGIDYDAVGGELDFAVGQAQASFTVKVYGDDTADTQMLCFQLRLGQSSEGTVAPGMGSASATIVEPEVGNPGVQFGGDYNGNASFAFSTCTYHLDDTGSVEITVVRPGDTTGAAEAEYTTFDNDGNTGPSGDLTFGDGQSLGCPLDLNLAGSNLGANEGQFTINVRNPDASEYDYGTDATVNLNGSDNSGDDGGGGGGGGGQDTPYPIANNDTYYTTTNTPLSIAAPGVLGNDSDNPGFTLTPHYVWGNGPYHGYVTLNIDGSFTYTPDPTFVGTDTFGYKDTDNGGGTSNNVAIVSITVGPNPVANPDSYTVTHNTQLQVVAPGLLANDTDNPEYTLQVNGVVSQPSHGSVSVNPDGSFIYTPNNNYFGPDSFSYNDTDGSATSNTATVSITITDNPPSDSDASYIVEHDQTLTVNAASGVLATDSDPDGDPLNAVLLSGPSHGSLGTAGLNEDGSFTYTPSAGFAGLDSFTYAANDGMQNGNTATVVIDVTNAAPVAAGDYYSTPAGQALSVSGPGVLAGAYDPDGDTLTAQLVTGPSHGTLTNNAINSDGSFTYTPTSGYIGQDSFTFTASDKIATSAPATVTITVVGTSPVANDIAYTTPMNQTLTMDTPGVLGNDVAPPGETLTAVAESGTTGNGGSYSVTSSGQVSYTPPANFTGVDYFNYQAAANGQASAPAQVAINVVNVALAMPNGPWVPIDAGDNNGSPWVDGTNDMVPWERDFQTLGLYQLASPLSVDDAQLQPLNIAYNPNPPAGAGGWLQLSVQSTGTGQIRLWRTATKGDLNQINPGYYPLTGPDSLPPTIYVEGDNPTSATPVPGLPNQPQDNTDITVTVTYWLQFAAPGRPPGAVRAGSSTVNLGVGPVVNFFTINNAPNAPVPNPRQQLSTGAVMFNNDPRLQQNGANDFSDGYTTVGVNPVNPYQIVQFPGGGNYPGAVFDAQVFNANTPGNIQFVQNLTTINGGNGFADAFFFGMGNGNPQNWQYIGQNNQVIAAPILDAVADPSVTGNPFYAQQNHAVAINLLPPNTTQVSQSDAPRSSMQGLINAGLNTVGPVTDVNWTDSFKLYLVWEMPAGGGAAGGGNGQVIYTLAVRPWRAVLYAHSNSPPLVADVIDEGSGVFAPGDFVITHNSPVTLNGPIANDTGRIR